MNIHPAAPLCTLLVLTGCDRKAAENAGSEIVPFVSMIQEQNQRYASTQTLSTPAAVKAARLAQQADLLAAFAKDQDAFLKKYYQWDRAFLFDAVVDGGVQMRVGCTGDGGKWVSDPQQLPPHSVVYSFGVGGDVSFDTDMAGRFGCEVHLFDPGPGVEAGFKGFVQGSPCGSGNVFYHPIGLGPCSEDSNTRWDLVINGKKCEALGLLAVARKLGNGRVDVLKVDIEGGEMLALPAALEEGAFEQLGIGQLQVEIHLWDDGQFIRFVKLIAALKQHGYEIFRKEFNPYNGSHCAEYAFVRVKS